MPDEAPFGTQLPTLDVDPPGPASRALAERLRAVESRNVTYLGPDFPVFWEEARGANVRDADGNVYVDLTGAFGVAFSGHADPRILAAVEEQCGRLVHGMGDVHPPSIKVELLDRLGGMMAWPEPRSVLASSGSEAVEVALKTAYLANHRPGILAFEGGYHGLTMGALAATARPDFRRPFGARLYPGTAVLPFPDRLRHGEEGARRILNRVEAVLEEGTPVGDPVGAVVVEPVQGRGGVRLAPDGFFRGLGERVRESDALLVADEIFTGLGRTGSVLASRRVGLEPDLICLGKALGGGFPLSACVGPAGVMDAWPPSGGEALHTSTFLGHPASCAASLAFLDRLEEDELADRSAALGERLREALRKELSGERRVAEVRGLGLMIGVELVDDPETLEPADGLAARVAATALESGVLVLPAGDRAHVVQLTPPAVLTDEQAGHAVEVLGRAIRSAGRE